MRERYRVIVIGGGHAGTEAAWAAANVLSGRGDAANAVALVTMDPSRIGVMSCNPANGGLAKGQMIREIDALGGLMGLATDATGIQFKMLNTSKGAAVRGPRAQCDKHAYAEAVRGMIASRPEIDVVAGCIERMIVEGGVIVGVVVGDRLIRADAVVLTTGTFMRGLMHTGDSRTAGGRVGEAAAVGISDELTRLGFELGRLKTGTPPRLRRGSIDWDALEPQHGDDPASPFSSLTSRGGTLDAFPSLARFPVLPQVACRITSTNGGIHDTIRANLHRAPMYSGQIESAGPRYCPSIEDKVVRFADRESHHVYLEPESLRDDWVYCNGISTSLPADVQDEIVRRMPGCSRAEILRHGYAVEYDMVRPHQIEATTETKPVRGLFLAGQINGTSGYEEAAGQGVVAGINAGLRSCGEAPITLGREEAYIGVLLDDLSTKTPVEPYRMFTSRAEHRLLLRADNADDRLTPIARRLGMLGGHELGRRRAALFEQRTRDLVALRAMIDRARVGDRPLAEALRRPEFTTGAMREAVGVTGETFDPGVLFTAHHDAFYAPYQTKAASQIARMKDLERRTIPTQLDFERVPHLRNEARAALARFRPRTLGQASRLEGITPADVTLLAVLVKQAPWGGRGS